MKTGDFPAAPQVGSPRREKNFDTAPFSTIYKVQIPKDFYKSLNSMACNISVKSVSVNNLDIAVLPMICAIAQDLKSIHYQ